MIKKLTDKSGMSLMEMLASLLVLVLLIVGMNAGMSAGLRIYQESKVAADRSALTSGINTKLTDILRYAEVKTITADDEDTYLFTNLEYGLWDVKFIADDDGIVQVCFYDKTGTQKVKQTPLIHSELYSVFKVEDLKLEPDGNCFSISYNLINTGKDSSETISTVVRIMND